MITMVVTRTRMASAIIRPTNPDARCAGSVQKRLSSPLVFGPKPDSTRNGTEHRADQNDQRNSSVDTRLAGGGADRVSEDNSEHDESQSRVQQRLDRGGRIARPTDEQTPSLNQAVSPQSLCGVFRKRCIGFREVERATTSWLAVVEFASVDTGHHARLVLAQ